MPGLARTGETLGVCGPPSGDLVTRPVFPQHASLSGSPRNLQPKPSRAPWECGPAETGLQPQKHRAVSCGRPRGGDFTGAVSGDRPEWTAAGAPGRGHVGSS